MDDSRFKKDLSESDWIEVESLSVLMRPRSQMSWFSSGTMVAMAFQLYGHLNTYLIAAWLSVSLLVLLFRHHIKSIFRQHFLNADVNEQNAFVEKNQLAWLLNALTWGISGWLFFTNIPIEQQYVGAIILTVVGFVAVHNLNTNHYISSRFIHILMGTQLLGAFWYVGYGLHFKATELQYIHILSLGTIWILLNLFNRRFHTNFRRNLTLQYRNHNLIRSLNLKTEQLAHEKQVATNANEVIQRFYSSSAHDIRQPVYALKLYAEMGAADQAQLPNLLPKITASCDAIHKLFDSLFEFEQINAGHVHILHETVDIDEVIEDLEHQFKPLAHHKNLKFRTNAVSGYLQTDQLLIKRILTCFISNAVKYTEKGGILVSVRKRKSMIVFEVWDTGIGIDPIHLSHVFEEFYKVGDFSSSDEGFGLGLSVVKRLSAYAEGSCISVNSRLGVGSVFRFELPIKTYAQPYIRSRFDSSQTLPIVIDHHLS
jgi:two-component system, sensor histidine kinase